MLRVLLPITALLTSVALLLGGNGLLGTLLAVRSQTEGWGERTTGLVMSGYFVGFFLGTFTAPLLIRRVGHIRAFAFHAALAAAAVLVYPLWMEPMGWLALRVVTGMALVGLCTVIESWLNAQAAPEHRSRVFAVYMVVTLLALASGQLLLDLQPPRSPVLFSLVAILFALAILPVSTTQLQPPTLSTAPRTHILQLCRAAPSAAAGALLAGLALGAFWGLGAVYAASLGLDRAGIGTFMAVTILGGAALQLPIGRLSDRGDRRSTLAVVAALGSVTAMLALRVEAATPAGGAIAGRMQCVAPVERHRRCGGPRAGRRADAAVRRNGVAGLLRLHAGTAGPDCRRTPPAQGPPSAASGALPSHAPHHAHRAGDAARDPGRPSDPGTRFAAELIPINAAPARCP